MKRWLIPVLICLLLQGASRFAAAPFTGLNLDDWGLLAKARSCDSYRDAMALTLKEPDRPFQAGLLTATFRFLDDRASGYALLSIGAYSLFLALAMAMVFQLTRSGRTALFFGVIFSLLPNLTESFHWGAMIAVAYMQIAYVASALCWILYVSRPRPGLLALSVLLFAIGLGTYEFGIGLPAAYVLLGTRMGYRRLGVALSPFILVIACYLTWRFSHGFGTAHGVWFESRIPELSIPGLLWNAREILGWWLGENMLNCLREGFNGFALLEPWPRRLFFVADIAIVLALTRYLTRAPAGPAVASSTHSSARIALFALAWAALGHAPSLLAWPAARLNFFPAIGVALLIALLLSQWPTLRWRTGFGVAAFLCLLANQGTARSWKESARFQQNIYAYLEAHQSEWVDKELILFDSRDLRQRTTPGLLRPPSENPFVWPAYQNAGLLRGYMPGAMVRLIKGREPFPGTILDLEHAPRIEGNELVFTSRYNPAIVYRTPLERVYTVDLFEAGREK